MRKIATIGLSLLFELSLNAQLNFKTIVPLQPVVAGESFQVQYIIEGGDKSMNIRPPVFSNFRLVAGPNVYMGSVSSVSSTRPLHNTVYTLEPVRPGRFVIPGATLLVNGKPIRSNTVFVEVISKEEAVKRFNRAKGINPSDYFLRPGENASDKIRKNLFIKVMVDKKNCFVGQPVLATFKLYSRLESKSDIVKNPGFYGFTVYDMVNLADKQVTTENVNGNAFDVHTIRKVQLYPLQAGVFTIDAMEVTNKVEFSKSAVNKKTEQEITEGVLGADVPENSNDGTAVYETAISTEPVRITVNPVPDKNKPASFTGATGHFSITAALANKKLSKNEQGFLEITITGNGNFIQLTAPAVQWPAGVEAFDPLVKDELDKTKMPLAGSRTFRYPFVCASPGSLQLLPVIFSFFDTDSNTYKTITTKQIDVIVGTEENTKPLTEEHKASIAEKSEQAARTAGIIVVALVLLIVVYWVFRKKEPDAPIMVEQQPTLPSVKSLLEPAYAVIASEGNQFYSVLHTILWNFAAGKFKLAGSEMNKQMMVIKMNSTGLGDEAKNEFLALLTHCEAGLFTAADLQEDKQALLNATALVLEKMIDLEDVSI